MNSCIAVMSLSAAAVGCGGGSASGGTDSATTQNNLTPQSAPAPVASASAPAPVASEPAPVASAPAPVTSEPAPVAPAPAPVAATQPLAANPLQSRALPNLTRIETPTPWDHKAEYPSRSACGATEGLTFEVGTGKAYSTPRDVPWIKLLPCDVVKIYYRPEAYKDIIFIGARGEKNKYITITGVPGPNGERPVFDGAGAISPASTGTGMPPVFDGFGMIIISRPVNIGGSLTSASYGYKPGYLHIKGLTVQNARTPATFTSLQPDAQGRPVVKTYDNFTSGIYVAPAEHLAITDCELANNGLGLFVNSNQDDIAPSYMGNARQSRNLLLRNNYFHDNGIEGNTSLHNAYTEAIGTVYEYNYFGRPMGTAADNIKDRSAGIIFRNNYIDSAMHNIALRDPESNGPYEATQKDALGEDLVKHVFIYNNVFIQRLIGSNGGIVIGHGDGDFGAQKQFRYGKVFFYSNRVISKYDYQMYGRDGAPLFEMLNYNRGTEVNAVNNLLYATSATATGTAANFSLFYWSGVANFPNFVSSVTNTAQPANWINKFIEAMPNYGNYASSPNSPNLFAGTKYNGTGHDGLTKQTNDPGFNNFAAGDYSLKSTSPFYSLKAPLPTEVNTRALTPSGEPVLAPFKAPALP